MKVMLVNGSSHLHGTTMAVFHSEEVETGCSAWRKADSRLSSM